MSGGKPNIAHNGKEAQEKVEKAVARITDACNDIAHEDDLSDIELVEALKLVMESFEAGFNTRPDARMLSEMKEHTIDKCIEKLESFRQDLKEDMLPIAEFKNQVIALTNAIECLEELKEESPPLSSPSLKTGVSTGAD